ncbi:MAG: hypothetical protein U1D33_02325 [bacterium]|nr:hypothetical protein [bacterium]
MRPILTRLLVLTLLLSLWSSVFGLRSISAKPPDPNYPLANALLTTNTIADIQRY